MRQVGLRIACALGALGCLSWAAWLALDWADYGPDGTCGNFIRYKGVGAACARVVHGRIILFIILVVVALALLGFGLLYRPSPHEP